MSSLSDYKNKVATITGHRPEDLFSADEWVKAALKEAYETLVPEKIIQGMAAGVDLWSAVVAWHCKVPYECAQPWAGHSPRKSDEYMYSWVLKHADKITVVNSSADYPGAFVYHVRNRYMIDNGDYLIAVWGGKTSGGTYAAIRYAQELERPILHINPKFKKTTWLG